MHNDSTQIGLQGMLRMNNILFDQHGQVKIQDLSNVYFQECQTRLEDLIFLPPEILKGNKDKYSSNIDVWTLGMILLHCISLQFRLEEEMPNIKAQILQIYSMLQTESLIHIEDDNADETSSQKNAANSSKNEETSPEKSKSSGWHEFFAKDGTKTD